MTAEAIDWPFKLQNVIFELNSRHEIPGMNAISHSLCGINAINIGNITKLGGTRAVLRKYTNQTNPNASPLYKFRPRIEL